MARRATEELGNQIERMRETPAFEAYRRVRDEVLRLKDLEIHQVDDLAAPSEYWSEELANFDYMLDASPLVVAKLRQHTHHVTGLRVYEYRSHQTARRQGLQAKLGALVEVGGRDLLVPESPGLGGFGFEIDGDLYNLDTLKFYEALIALQRGGVLGEFRTGPDRRVVCEVGAGWGGFAYQFKTVCPRCTYLMIDFPELFLFSAVYLMTLFPDARVLFYDGSQQAEAQEGFREFDFVFIPATALDRLPLARLDLVVNMVSFQEMTTEQVRKYVNWAAERRCPYLYSLNRDRSFYNPELTSVRRIIGERYQPQEVPVMDVEYLELRARLSLAERVRRLFARGPDLRYKHVIGRAPAPLRSGA